MFGYSTQVTWRSTEDWDVSTLCNFNILMHELSNNSNGISITTFLNEFVTPFRAKSLPPNHAMLVAMVPVKVKWSHYRPVVAQRVGRGIALLFHDRGSRRGWVMVLEYFVGRQFFSQGNWSRVSHTNFSSMMTVTSTFVHKKELTIFCSTCLAYVKFMNGLLPVEDKKVELSLYMSWRHTRWVKV